MKNLSKFAMGAVLGASVLAGGCGNSSYVGGKVLPAATQASPLVLDQGAAYVNEWDGPSIVWQSRLLGYYSTCYGKGYNEQWTMVLGQANTDVKVLQGDAKCELTAYAIERDTYSQNSDCQAPQPGAGPEEIQNFVNSCVATDTYYFRYMGNTPSVPSAAKLGSIYGGDAIVIRDGFDPANLVQAVNDNGQVSALLNIAGLHTGEQGSGAGGYQQDFQVTVLTGSTSDDLTQKDTAANINYSKNVSAAAKELPAPSYLLSSTGVRIATTTDGYLTAASYGNFKFEPAADVFGNSQYGTEYIVASARDDSQAWDYSAGYYTLTQLPWGNDWRNLSQDARYNMLHNRWNLLSKRLRPVKAITTADHSFAVPVLAAFPVKTRLFMVYPPSEGSELGSWENFQNQSIVIIRYKADDTSGGDFSADSGVVSYQAFSINVTPPCEAFGCGGNVVFGAAN